MGEEESGAAVKIRAPLDTADQRHAPLFPLRRLPCAWMQETLTLLAAYEGDDDADLVQDCPWYLLDFGDVDEIDDFSNVGLHSSTQDVKLKKPLVYSMFVW
jgi:hypothetical protein